jgi:hypothetical protein
MDPKYVLQLLLSGKSQTADNSATTKAKEQNKDRFEIPQISEFF